MPTPKRDKNRTSNTHNMAAELIRSGARSDPSLGDCGPGKNLQPLPTSREDESNADDKVGDFDCVIGHEFQPTGDEQSKAKDTQPDDAADPMAKANDLKKTGNDFFQSGQNVAAETAYARACATDPKNPILYSNHAAALLALGNYSGAVEAARSGLRCPEIPPKIEAKLKRRLAKALFYRREWAESIAILESISKASRTPDEQATLSAAKELLKSGIMADQANPGVERDCGKVRLRPAPFDQWTTGGSFVGHDEVMPAFGMALYDPATVVAFAQNVIETVQPGYRLPPPNAPRDKPPPVCGTKHMALEKIITSADPTINLFFGGVGDFRHPIASLAQLWRKLSGLLDQGRVTMEQVRRLSIKITAADVFKPALTRGWTMFSLLHEYGQALRSGKDIAKHRSILFLTYLGVLLPSDVHDAIMQVAHGTPKVGESTPWGGRFDDEASAAAVAATFDEWRASTVTSKQVFDAAGGSEHVPSDVIKSQFTQTVMSCPPSELIRIASSMGLCKPDASGMSSAALEQLESDVLANAAEYCKSDPAFMHYLNYPDLPVDQHAYKCIAGFHKLCRVLFDWTKLFPELKSHLNPNPRETIAVFCSVFEKMALPRLKPNPTRFKVLQKLNQQMSPFQTMRFLLGGDAMALDLFGPRRVGPAASPEALLDPFFADAARAIHFLSAFNGLEISFRHGDMHKTATQIISGTQMSFDRIYLSNVPDYTTLLQAFARFLPMLKDSPEGILIHTFFIDMAERQTTTENVWATTRIPSIELVEQLLGARLISGGSQWKHVAWELDPTRRLSQSMTQAKFTTWLHDLFLSIVRPPIVKTEDMLKEMTSMNAASMDTFFEVLKWLVADDGMKAPKHWVAEVLAALFDNRLDTAARAPTHRFELPAQSPLLAPHPKSRVDVSFFRAELNRCWKTHGADLGLILPTPLVLPLTADRLVTCISTLGKEQYHMRWGRAQPENGPSGANVREMIINALNYRPGMGLMLVTHRSMRRLAQLYQETSSRSKADWSLASFGETVQSNGGDAHIFTSFDWCEETREFRVEVCASLVEHWRREKLAGIWEMFFPDFPAFGVVHQEAAVALWTNVEHQNGYTWRVSGM